MWSTWRRLWGTRIGGGAVSLLLHGAYSLPKRAQEHRADCSPALESSLSRPGGASIAAPFCRERRLVAGKPCCGRFEPLFLPAIEKSGRIRAGSWTTRGSRRRAFIRSEGRPPVLRTTLASRTQLSDCGLTVGSQRAPQACRSPFGSTFPKIGQSIRFAGPEPTCPRTSSSKTKPQIALDQIRAARAAGVPEGVVLADAGCRINTAFRTALTRIGLTYVVGIQSSARLWPPGARSAPAQCMDRARSTPDADAARRGARTSLSRPSNSPSRCRLTPGARRRMARRRRQNAPFPASPACGFGPRIAIYWRSHPYAEEWLLVEWPQDESAPTKYWLSTLPADTALATLVETAKLRWRIERDYQELKQELPGSITTKDESWRGFSPPHGALRRSVPDSWSPNGGPDSPSDDKTVLIEAALAYPPVIDPPRIRRSEPNADVITSIASFRINLARNIARRLPRCPCCQRANL